jgi:hypothetical protein
MATHTRTVQSFNNGEREPRFFVREIFDFPTDKYACL